MCWDRPVKKYWSICLPLKHGNGRGNLAFVCRVLWEGKAMSWLTGNTPHLVSRIHVSPLVTGGQMKQRGKSVRSGEAEVTWALGFLSTWQSQVAWWWRASLNSPTIPFLSDTQNGTLKIIDRKKHIFKLAQGEYIAPEKIENIYLRSEAVAQVFVHGESLQVCSELEPLLRTQVPCTVGHSYSTSIWQCEGSWPGSQPGLRFIGTCFKKSKQTGEWQFESVSIDLALVLPYHQLSVGFYSIGLSYPPKFFSLQFLDFNTS